MCTEKMRPLSLSGAEKIAFETDLCIHRLASLLKFIKNLSSEYQSFGDLEYVLLLTIPFEYYSNLF